MEGKKMLMEIQTGSTLQTEAQAGACRATTVHAPQDLKETSATFSQKHYDMIFLSPSRQGQIWCLSFEDCDTPGQQQHTTARIMTVTLSG